MRSKIIATSILAAVGAVGAWLLFHRPSSPDGFDRTQNVLPSETKKVLDTGQRFILLSLDPELPEQSDPLPKETFHYFAVLGKTEIRDARERADLLHALYKGIADSDGLAPKCFNPRHGISATLGGETVDLVICFECLSIQTYGKAGKSVFTTRSPEPIFNRVLENARLPIAKEK